MQITDVILSAIPEYVPWVLLILFFAFIGFFCLPFWKVKRELNRAIKKIKEADQIHTKEELKACFEKSMILQSIIQEYVETLHEQSEIDAQTGQHRIIRIRSTIPAEAFFKTEVIIDTPLRTDFFKHLPGLFTGVGIIGTFCGLLKGLQAFKISEDAVVVRESLNSLLHGVYEAFHVSAIAIGLAMLITFFEKLMVMSLTRKLEELVQELDGLFEAGAGEEYLARLVKSSEKSESQTAILKDALVGELKQILSELTEKQIAASTAGNNFLAQRIGESLQAPMAEIASACKRVSGDQGSAVQSLLADVLSAFTQELKGLFGDQIGGINQLQQQTIQALQSAVENLNEMSRKFESAGTQGADAMARQLRESMESAEQRQLKLNDKMTEFVEQIRQSINSSQQDVTTQSKKVVSEFGEQASQVAEGVGQVVAEMKTVVDSMNTITSSALSKMNTGADTLYAAATDFAKAGAGVNSTLDKSAALTTQLSQTAGSLSSATTGLSALFADYKMARDSVGQMVSSLQLIVDQARREASMSGDVLKVIDEATDKLMTAQQNADQYLDKVSDVLAKSHEAFSSGMKKSLSESSTAFHQNLINAVGLLADAAERFSSAFTDATDQIEKIANR